MAVLTAAGADTLPELSGPPRIVAIGTEPIRPIPNPPAYPPRVVALGKTLFSDQRLSANDRMSCASCHDLATNGATSRTTDPALGESGSNRNTPTVFNAVLNFRLNWAGESRTLQDQADGSLRFEMGQDVAAGVAKLAAEPGMLEQFRQAFGHGPDRATVLDALATFEATLLTPQSAFDRWLQGASDALSPEARQGYERFKLVGCISCHQGVNVGGNLFQPSGVYRVLTDPSRPILRVPSLRNVATTAPYFHDGGTATLSEAVRLMARAQLDRAVSDEDVRTITAFLRSLTGQYEGHPVTAPDAGH